MKYILTLWMAFAACNVYASIPNALTSSGTATSAGIVCSLTQGGADGWIVILDGSSVATSTITVAVQVFDPTSSTFVTPIGIGNPNTADPITLTNATTQIIWIPGGFPGIQINVTSFGTATGTFRGVLLDY